MSTELAVINYANLITAQVPAILPSAGGIMPSSPESCAMINRLAVAMREKLVPTKYVTEHMVHGGIYTRTVRFPPKTLIAAARFIAPTTLIIKGTCDIWSDGDVARVEGYTVIKGSAGRKIALVTVTDVEASMMFRTDLTDVAEIQKQFTDEYMMLAPLENADEHVVLVTGE